MSVFVDHAKVYNGEGTSALVPLPPAQSSSNYSINIAANSNGQGAYPLESSTLTLDPDNPYKAIDGSRFYDETSDNRWTNHRFPSANDTLQITFARPWKISSVTVASF